jgi:hypothetical protein
MTTNANRTPRLVLTPAAPRKPKDGNAEKLKDGKDKIMADLHRAKRAIQPSLSAAVVIAEFGGHSDVAALAVQLQIDMNAIKKNDLRGCEEMLYSQAHALAAIFESLAVQARGEAEEFLPNFEVSMRLALKAQSQCRATLETLAIMKNPPAVFSQQANIAQGPQQVNNGMMPAGEPRAGAGETKKPQTKLLSEEKPQDAG